VTRRFRGADYHINVMNPNRVSKGVVSMTVNGKYVEGNVIPPQKGKKSVQVEVVLG
jgi:cellobiose phosphorylase